MFATLPVLTYHSISDSSGPTSIPVDVFEMQMRVLAEEGYRSQTLTEFADWHERRGDRGDDGGKRLLITFDDAFADFARTAAPILRTHGFSAVVFVPTARIGNGEIWKGASEPARPLMDWNTIRDLARNGMEFGGHSRTHADLTALSGAALEREIADCAKELSAEIGGEIEGFAAPYGRVDRHVIAAIGQHYRVAFGTRLARARQGQDRFDIPRIEMHYFRNERHWRGLLRGKVGYLRARQALRAVRAIAGGAFG